MKKIIAILFAIAVFTHSAQAQTVLTNHVEDADTIHVEDHLGRTVKVRIQGIDAPEVCHQAHDKACTKKPGQPLGAEAKAFAQRLVLGKKVLLKCNGTSTHDRTVCQVFVGNTDLGLELLRAGLAWYEPKFLKDTSYYQAEAQAQAARKGVYASASHVRPSVWRKQCWQQKICS